MDLSWPLFHFFVILILQLTDTGTLQFFAGVGFRTWDLLCLKRLTLPSAAQPRHSHQHSLQFVKVIFPSLRSTLTKQLRKKKKSQQEKKSLMCNSKVFQDCKSLFREWRRKRKKSRSWVFFFFRFKLWQFEAFLVSELFRFMHFKRLCFSEDVVKRIFSGSRDLISKRLIPSHTHAHMHTHTHTHAHTHMHTCTGTNRLSYTHTHTQSFSITQTLT